MIDGQWWLMMVNHGVYDDQYCRNLCSPTNPTANLVEGLGNTHDPDQAQLSEWLRRTRISSPKNQERGFRALNATRTLDCNSRNHLLMTWDPCECLWFHPISPSASTSRNVLKQLSRISVVGHSGSPSRGSQPCWSEWVAEVWSHLRTDQRSPAQPGILVLA